MQIGKVLKKLRKDKGVAQGVFAKDIGIQHSYLSLIEGDKLEASLPLLKKICSLLGVPLPIVMFMGLEDSDVKEDKQELFKSVKPVMDKIIEQYI